jgi:hypothetical protein
MRLGPSFDSGRRKAQPRSEWTLHVSLHDRAPGALASAVSHDSDSRVFVIAGSFSPVFTTSGVSSEDISPTGGRYGYVVTWALGAGVETIILPLVPSKPCTDLALG